MQALFYASAVALIFGLGNHFGRGRRWRWLGRSTRIDSAAVQSVFQRMGAVPAREGVPTREPPEGGADDDETVRLLPDGYPDRRGSVSELHQPARHGDLMTPREPPTSPGPRT